MKSSKVFNISPAPATAAAGAAPAQAVARQSAVAFRELVRLLGDGAGLRAATDVLAFNAEAEALMRGVLARYGFERLPATQGELLALFEYCDSLDAASGVGMRPDSDLAEWQAASFLVWRRKSPQLMPAIELFCVGDIDALRALHRVQDTLTTLGRSYLDDRA
jgi:hypothetical protein